MKRFRNLVYHFSLELGLFYFLPVIVRLPKPFSKAFLKLKAYIRFSLGSYRAYIDRPYLKQIAIKNLMDTLGLSKENARNKVFCLMQLEIFAERNGYLFDFYTLSDLENHFTIHGIDTIENELTKGKGVIFATIHSGDTVLLMLFLSLKGYKVYGLFDEGIKYKKSKNPLEKFAKLKDEKITGKIGKLYSGKGMMKLFNVLKKNAIIFWMVDLPTLNVKRKLPVYFLGKTIEVSNSFLDVAVKTGASLLPHINIYDCKNDRHEVYIGSPFNLTKNTIQDLFCFYEPYIRKFPESWLGWYFFDMFKKDN